MPLRLYNTLTRREEDFLPMDAQGKTVTMYTCGPTVYGRPHVGNYASFLLADLLRRWLEAGHGYRVRHVKNITDVGHLLHDADQGDDKIQREAEREKAKRGAGGSGVTREDVLAVAEKYTEQFLEDERALNMLEPEARPRASAFIREQLRIIRALLQKGFAYETEDGMYFSVEKFPAYGGLSGNTLEHLSAGARVPVDERKRHPADFALWKKCVGMNAAHVLRWVFATGDVSSTTGEDASSGFPGWHIECSAMSSSLLGEQLDIHTGGEDNIFPHHECEIAQSECASGRHPFVRMWVHRRRIQLGEEKMSKSLGNVLSLPDILRRGFSAMDLRLYLLSVHYRTHLKFTEHGLEEAKKQRRAIMEWMQEVGEKGAGEPRGAAGEAQAWERKFRAAMDADLNVSDALAAVHGAMAASRRRGEFASFGTFVRLVQETFGCFPPESSDISGEALRLARQRDAARAAKDFPESDRLRHVLTGMGYEVRDTPHGTVLRRRR